MAAPACDVHRSESTRETPVWREHLPMKVLVALPIIEAA